ncbi:phosphoribosylanthranilate isomerase [Actinokineospora soli]|uniref:N-(5'-phosphoribosyl)anthranilate isomerase n=1 Tax=Actinokineospora soli TaxID=1048753 RepID=A0ABW2TUR5_9PSEU
MFVKVCGLKTAVDVAAAVSAGADAIGFVFARSPRRSTPGWPAPSPRKSPRGADRRRLQGRPGLPGRRHRPRGGRRRRPTPRRLPPEAFTHFEGVRLIRATTLTPETDTRVGAYGEDILLLDSAIAGSGERWDLTDLPLPTGDWLLAGGLTPANVTTAITEANPWGVDVSSGVEVRRGVKDPALIRDFIAAAKG